MLIKIKDQPWYICGLHGSVFLTWVHESDMDHAADFKPESVDEWVRVLSKATGFELEKAYPSWQKILSNSGII